MYIDVGSYISWSNEPSVPFSSGMVANLQGQLPGDHINMGVIDVSNGDGTLWTINAYNILDMGTINGNMGTTHVVIDQYAIGDAVSQGIISSGMLNNYTPDNAPQLNMIADKLQQIIDKDKPIEVPPVAIPDIDEEILIL